MATTVSPLLAVFFLSTIKISPSYIPTLIIDSPLTFRVKISFLVVKRLVGRAKYSSGVSIASIGFPAVTFPSRGTSTMFSSFSIYSFGTNTSIVLFFPFPLWIYPFSSNFVR